MSDRSQRRAYGALGLSTLAFTACFALWVQNGVLVTHLSEQGTFSFDEVEIGWLLGAPILTGSILRLPVGLLSDRYGGRRVFTAVLLAAALGAVALSQAQGFWSFLVGSLGFGVAGTSFAVGVAYTSSWFPKERQGTALGIFGAGNAGSAVATLLTPWMLEFFTAGGADPEGWRAVPLAYAGLMLVVAVAFARLAGTPPQAAPASVSLSEQLTVLRSARVWRFGLYYFLVFGCFVALAQWLVPYYTSVFGMSLATAGLLAAVFSFPSGVVRALGGWMSDRWGARRTMYGVLGVCAAGCFALSVPSMNVGLFTFLVLLVGLAMGVGKAAVYKYIPEYFPGQVGAVGGLVGVIGGLGGFVCPILFGYLSRSTGLWTSSWAFLFVLSVVCLVWLHVVVGRIERRPQAIEGPEEAEPMPASRHVPARGVVS